MKLSLGLRRSDHVNSSEGSTFNAIGISGTVTMVAGHFINGDYNVVQDGGIGVESRVKGIQDDQKSSYLLSSQDLGSFILIFILERDIDKWMSAPDTSSNYKAAREKHQPGTGSWLVDGSVFENWKGHPDSILWLHGGREWFKLAKLHHAHGGTPQLGVERRYYGGFQLP